MTTKLELQALYFIRERPDQQGPGLPSSTWPPSLSFRPCTLYQRDLTNKDQVYQALHDHQAWASGPVLYTRETWPTRTRSTKLYMTTKLELQALYFIPERPDQQGPGLPSSTWPPSLSFRPCTLRTRSTKLYMTTKLELQALYFIPERPDQQGQGLPSSTWPPSLSFRPCTLRTRSCTFRTRSTKLTWPPNLSFRPCTLYQRDLTNKDQVYQALHDHQAWASGPVLYTRETWPTRTRSTKLYMTTKLELQALYFNDQVYQALHDHQAWASGPVLYTRETWPTRTRSTKLYMTTKLELQALYFIPERPDQQGQGLPSSTWPPSLSFRPCTLRTRSTKLYMTTKLELQALYFIPERPDQQGPGLPSSTWPPSLSFWPCTLYTRETWPTRTRSTKLYMTTKLEFQAMYFIPERPDQQGPGLPSSTWPPSLSFRPCTLHQRDLTNKDQVYQALHDHQAWASGHVLYTRETWPTRTRSTELYMTTKLELQAMYFIPERPDQQGPGLPSSTWPPSLSFRPCTLYQQGPGLPSSTWPPSCGWF